MGKDASWRKFTGRWNNLRILRGWQEVIIIRSMESAVARTATNWGGNENLRMIWGDMWKVRRLLSSSAAREQKEQRTVWGLGLGAKYQDSRSSKKTGILNPAKTLFWGQDPAWEELRLEDKVGTIVSIPKKPETPDHLKPSGPAKVAHPPPAPPLHVTILKLLPCRIHKPSSGSTPTSPHDHKKGQGKVAMTRRGHKEGFYSAGSVWYLHLGVGHMSVFTL